MQNVYSNYPMILKNRSGINRQYTETKNFSKCFFTYLVFVYKSVSLKRFRIEQLLTALISLIFVHYSIM